MRRYLTTLRWYEDRLCSLSSAWLIALSLACLAGLGTLAFWMPQFFDDLTFLVSESDVRILATLLGLLLLTSAGLWVLSFSLAALGRRLVLYVKGL